LALGATPEEPQENYKAIVEEDLGESAENEKERFSQAVSISPSKTFKQATITVFSR
jgi:hypothetical protein